MLSGAVVLVLVLTSPPLASSHAWRHGVRPPGGQPSTPWTGLLFSRLCRKLCDKLGCTEAEVCVVPHDDSAYCLESDPCWTHPCPDDSSQCIVVHGVPTCLSLDCEYDGSVYKHGEDDGCYYKCYMGTMKMMTFNPITGNQCVPPFETYEGNCYHYNNNLLTWCEARNKCRDAGGDLASNNFNTLKGFVDFRNQGGPTPWVGVRNKLWLNGQKPQQVIINFDDAEHLCGFIVPSGLADYSCELPLPFICQLN